jgi:3-hydroxyanthranilate 3,4-dioxygenase
MSQEMHGPYNFWQWADEHRERLKPPVGNALMFGNEFKVQVIAGPNQRTDFHIEEHEEFFHQIKGDMVLRIVDPDIKDRVEFKDIPIKEGEMFCLPAHVPHSPQRPADTLGLVVELERKEGEIDYMRWYCDKCRAIVHEDGFQCVDMGTQLKPIIQRYYNDEKLRTCKACGHVNVINK